LEDECSHDHVLENGNEKLMSQNPLECFQVSEFILGLKHKYLLYDHIELVTCQLQEEFTAAFGLPSDSAEFMISVYLTVLILRQ